MWKSQLPESTKLYVFPTIGHAILLFVCETWVMTQTLTKILDGAYTRLLRMVRNIPYAQKVTNIHLYGALPKISAVLRYRRIRHWEHVLRAPQPVKRCLMQTKPAKRKGGKRGRTRTYR